MNKIMNVTPFDTTVRYLNRGDVLTSGFVVTHRPWAGTRTPKGKVIVEGYYPNSPIKSHVFGASTRVTVAGEASF